jgi:hypothetical protein
MIIWKVKRKMGVRLEGIIRTLKFRVPEYNFLFSLLHGELVTIRTEYSGTFQRLVWYICADAWEDFYLHLQGGKRTQPPPPSCFCTLKGSGSFLRDFGVWAANGTAFCLTEGCENLRQCL